MKKTTSTAAVPIQRGDGENQRDVNTERNRKQGQEKEIELNSSVIK